MLPPKTTLKSPQVFAPTKMASHVGQYQSDSSVLTGASSDVPSAPITPPGPAAGSSATDFTDNTTGRIRRKSALMNGPARDGGWGWLIVFASFLCNMLVVGIGESFVILLDPLAKTFAPNSRGSLMWVGTVQMGVYYLVGPLVSALTNKYGCRKVTIAGSVITVIGFMVSTRSPSLLVMIFTYGVLGGIGFGMIYLPSIVIVGHWFEKRRAFATGLAVCGSGVGAILIPRLANHLYTEYTWKGGVTILAALLFHCAFFGSFFRPLQPFKPNRHRRGVMPHGTIMTALIAAKRRDRTISNGSLDNCMITRDNRIVMIESHRNCAHLKQKSVLNNIVHHGTVYTTAINQSNRPRLKTAIPPRLLHVTSNVAAHSYDDIAVGDAEPSNRQASPNLGVKSRSCHFTLNPLESIGDSLNTPGDTSAGTPAPALKTQHVNVINGDGGYYSVPVSRCSSTASLRQRLARSSRSLSDCSQLIPAVMVGSSLNSMPRYACTGSQTVSHIYYDDIDAERSLFQHVKDVINEYFGTDLLKSVTFIVTVIVFILSSMGFFVPVVLLPLTAKVRLEKIDDNGIVHDPDMTFLISILGVADTVGRLISGWLADRLWMDALHLSNTCVVVAGAFTCFMPCFASSYSTMAAFAACFGLCMSVSITLRTIILVDLFGIHRLASSFGLLIFFLGIVTISSTPIVDLFYENSEHDLCSAFYVSGTLMIIAGCLGFPLRCIRDWENRRREKVRMTIEEVQFDESAQSDRDLLPGQCV